MPSFAELKDVILYSRIFPPYLEIYLQQFDTKLRYKVRKELKIIDSEYDSYFSKD